MRASGFGAGFIAGAATALTVLWLGVFYASARAADRTKPFGGKYYPIEVGEEPPGDD